MQDAGRRLQIARSKLQAASWSGEGCCLEIDPGSTSSTSTKQHQQQQQQGCRISQRVFGEWGGRSWLHQQLAWFWSVAGQGKLQLAAPLYFSQAPPPPPPPRSANRLFVLGPASGSPEPGIHKQPQQPLQSVLWCFVFLTPAFPSLPSPPHPPGRGQPAHHGLHPGSPGPAAQRHPGSPASSQRQVQVPAADPPKTAPKDEQHHTAPPCGIQSHPAPILEHQPSLQSVQPANPCAPTAENALKEEAKKPKYSLSLLSIVNTAAQPLKTRLAAALAFKNFIRLNYVVRPIGRPAPCSFRS